MKTKKQVHFFFSLTAMSGNYNVFNKIIVFCSCFLAPADIGRIGRPATVTSSKITEWPSHLLGQIFKETPNSSSASFKCSGGRAVKGWPLKHRGRQTPIPCNERGQRNASALGILPETMPTLPFLLPVNPGGVYLKKPGKSCLIFFG